MPRTLPRHRGGSAVGSIAPSACSARASWSPGGCPASQPQTYSERRRPRPASGRAPGGGGTQIAVGAGGPSPSPQPSPVVAAEPGGTQTVPGGSAGGKAASNQPYIIVGGGGGGYYGGGGGGTFYGVSHDGGGGGSGYINPSFVTSGTLYSGSGATAGNNTDPLYLPSYAFGGSPNGTPGPLTVGGNGAIIVVA